MGILIQATHHDRIRFSLTACHRNTRSNPQRKTRTEFRAEPWVQHELLLCSASAASGLTRCRASWSGRLKMAPIWRRVASWVSARRRRRQQEKSEVSVLASEQRGAAVTESVASRGIIRDVLAVFTDGRRRGGVDGVVGWQYCRAAHLVLHAANSVFFCHVLEAVNARRRSAATGDVGGRCLHRALHVAFGAIDCVMIVTSSLSSKDGGVERPPSASVAAVTAWERASRSS